MVFSWGWTFTGQNWAKYCTGCMIHQNEIKYVEYPKLRILNG